MRQMFHLWKPKGRLNYSVRLTVPEDLRELVGQSEIVHSLGTPDKRLAKRKMLEVLPRISHRIKEAQKRKDRLDLLNAELTPFIDPPSGAMPKGHRSGGRDAGSTPSTAADRVQIANRTNG